MDNDKQKSTENNSSARPGIFSTPDLTIDTEKLAQATPSTDANKARIASVFANTDATRQAQQSAITSQPVEGDIILNNTKKRHGKKFIIIATVVILLACIGVMYFMIANNGHSGTKNEANDTTYKFNAFANYILFGQQSNNDLSGDYDPSFTYAIENNINTDEKSNVFWKQATTLLNDAMQSDEMPPNDVIAGNLLNGYYQNFQFLELYRRTTEPLRDKTVSEYMNGGIEQGLDYVRSVYTDFDQPDNEVSRVYYNLMIEQAEKDLEILDTYNKHGCILDGDIDATCEDELLSEPDTAAILDQYMNEYAEISNRSSALVKNALMSAIGNCWVISSRLQTDESIEDGVEEKL